VDITLGENMREFRKKKNNTQEELAEFLGITMQAVSKWERGEGLPDITLLPAIASFYNVTIDELMGFGTLKKEQRIQEILEDFKHSQKSGSAEEMLRLMRGAVKEFPNEHRIIVKLIWTLSNSGDQSFNDEIIVLVEKILNECTDSEIRNEAIGLLSITLGKFPESDEKAREYAMMLPLMWGYTREAVLARILSGDELLKFAHGHLHGLVYNIHMTIHFMLRSGGGFTLDECIQAKETTIKFWELLYGDGDLGRDHCNVAISYRNIAEWCAAAGRNDDAVKNLEFAYRHAEIYDTAPKHKLNSLLMKAVDFDPEDKYGNYWLEERKKLAQCMEQRCFDECRENPRFIELKNKL